MSVFDGTHTRVLNERDEVQEIPTHWLSHPTLSKQFRPVAGPKTSAKPADKSRGDQPKTPAAGEGKKESENA